MAQYASPTKITYITTNRRDGRHLTMMRPVRPVQPVAGRTSTHLTPTATRRATITRAATTRATTTPDKAVYRRRRLLAAGLFLLAIAAVLILAQLIQAGIGGGPLTATGAAASSAGNAGMIPAGTRHYIVQPGDTLWSIAARVDPQGDERPLVDALSRELKGESLYPGEQVPIPNRW